MFEERDERNVLFSLFPFNAAEAGSDYCSYIWNAPGSGECSCRTPIFCLPRSRFFFLVDNVAVSLIVFSVVCFYQRKYCQRRPVGERWIWTCGGRTGGL